MIDAPSREKKTLDNRSFSFTTVANVVDPSLKVMLAEYLNKFLYPIQAIQPCNIGNVKHSNTEISR